MVRSTFKVVSVTPFGDDAIVELAPVEATTNAPHSVAGSIQITFFGGTHDDTFQPENLVDVALTPR